MKTNKNSRLVTGIVYIILGLFLTMLGSHGVVDDFWSSFGVAIAIVGIANIIRHNKYMNNAEYREKVDLSNSDERIKFISMKAWSWAGYMFVLIAALGVLGFQIAGLRTWSLACSGSVCLVMVLYWISYMVLNKKY